MDSVMNISDLNILPEHSQESGSLCFKPEFPFDYYDIGRVRTHYIGGRLKVYLYKYNAVAEKRTTHMHLARYLMCLKVGRILGTEEQVDHIDNDRFHDDTDNLQILSGRENLHKSAHVRGKLIGVITCAYCGKIFRRLMPNIREHFSRKDALPITCSLTCSSLIQNTVLQGEIKAWVLRHQVLYVVREHDFPYSDIYGEFYPNCRIILPDDESISNPDLIANIRSDFNNPMNRYLGIDHLRNKLPENLRYDNVNLATPQEIKTNKIDIVNRMVVSGHSKEEIAKRLDISIPSLEILFQRNSIVTPNQWRAQLRFDEHNAMVAAGLTVSEIAEKFGTDKRNLRKFVRRHNLEMPL